MAQDFFAAFGHDGIGTIGTETTITSTDMDGILMIAAQGLEKRTEALTAENADLKARLEMKMPTSTGGLRLWNGGTAILRLLKLNRAAVRGVPRPIWRPGS